MQFKYLDNKPLESALSEYISLVQDTQSVKTEVIPVKNSLHRFTSQAVYAATSSPDYYAAAMDGIALRSSITFGVNETSPKILEIEKDFVIIDTGDCVPEWCDAVIMMEDVQYIDSRFVKIISSAYPFQHIRQIGEDICSGEMIISSFRLITPSTIGALLAGGVEYVNVVVKPVVSIIPTGDEIVDIADKTSHKGSIKEFNSAIFSAYINEWGGECIVYPIIPDSIELIRNALLDALTKSDIVLINAGSSAGRDDYTSTVISECGSVITHGISIKPGKPVILGVAGNKSVIGIPGYPVSGVIIMNTIVRKVIELWGKIYRESEVSINARLSKRLVSSLKYKEFIRVKLGRINEQLIALPLTSGAGIITSYMRADGIVTIDKNLEGIEAGSTVVVNLLKPLSEIEKNIIITGSHDPMIDEIDDILQCNKTGFSLSSTHVGSMGGIYAMKRGECHIAGIHLLDIETGEYNKSYVKTYCSEVDCTLIKGVKRVQGIIVAKDSRFSITSIADLVNHDIRFVNRQKGAGTRILFDHLLKKHSISPDMINGYGREEFTHISVAQQIASGGADAGLGVFSAAKMYDLDFIPLCEEEYDFVVQSQFFNSKGWAVFEEAIKSVVFKKRMEQAGGYV